MAIGGHEVPVVNTATLQSEVGNALCRKYPRTLFAATYMDVTANERVFSLRSTGDFNVATLAEKFGGGGHAHASGFRVGIHGNDILPNVKQDC